MRCGSIEVRQAGFTLLEAAIWIVATGLILLVFAGLSMTMRTVGHSPEIRAKAALEQIISEFALTGKMPAPSGANTSGGAMSGQIPFGLVSRLANEDLRYQVDPALLQPAPSGLARFNKLGEPASAPKSPDAIVLGVGAIGKADECARLRSMANNAITNGVYRPVVTVGSQRGTDTTGADTVSYSALELYGFLGCPAYMSRINKWVNATYLLKDQVKKAEIDLEVADRKVIADRFTLGTTIIRLFLYSGQAAKSVADTVEAWTQLSESKITGKAVFASTFPTATIGSIQFSYGAAFTLYHIQKYGKNLKKSEDKLDALTGYLQAVRAEQQKVHGELVAAYRDVN